MRVLFGVFTCLAGLIAGIVAWRHHSASLACASIALLLLGAWLIWQGLHAEDDSVPGHVADAVELASDIVDVLSD